MRSLFNKISLILILIILCNNVWADEFLSVADIHFDPFSSCSSKHCLLLEKLRQSNVDNWSKLFELYDHKAPSVAYQDTNYSLLKNTLQEFEKINKTEKLSFVIVLGDWLAHDFRGQYVEYSGDRSQAGYENFVKKTLQFLTLEFSELFSNIDVYPVVGNNDSYTGNYSSVPRGKFFQDIAQVWATLIKEGSNREAFLRSFPTGGYYAIDLPDHQKMLVLNTVLFSSYNHKKSVKEAGLTEINWLHQQLQSAKKTHEKIFLSYHIPVGIDVYASLTKQFAQIQEFWQPVFTKKFEKELRDSFPTVAQIFSAHIHMDVFQIITLKQLAEIPVNFTPSISPNYGNNPGFKIFAFDPKTMQLQKIQTYYYPLALSKKWEEEEKIF